MEAKKIMKIIIKDGLLWENNTTTKDNIIGCMGADSIARANGFHYAETMIDYYGAGKELNIDENHKIIKETK